MADHEKKSKEPISFEDLGGKKVGHRCQSCGSLVLEKSEKKISFEHLGGKKVGHLRLDTPEEESTEQNDDSSHHDES